MVLHLILWAVAAFKGLESVKLLAFFPLSSAMSNLAEKESTVIATRDSAKAP